MPRALVVLAVLAFACPVGPAQDVAGRFRRAVELQRQGALESAEAEYRAVLVEAPGYAEAHANLGAVLARLDRYDEAIASYEAALRLSPGLAPVLLNLGIAHYRRGKFDRALEALQRFLERSPGHSQAAQLAGLSLLELGRDAEAVEHLKTAAEQSNDAGALYGLGLAYVRLRSPELGGVLERLRGLPAGEARARLLSGLAHLDHSRFREATEDLERAAALDRELPRLYYSLGLGYLRLGRTKEALAAFSEELRRNPKDFTTHYYLAFLHDQDGDLASAQGRVGEALALEPASEEARALQEKVAAKAARLVPGRENGFVGSERCAACHQAQARKQSSSNMARAAFRTREHPLYERFRNEAARVQGLRFALRWEEGPVRMSISDGAREVEVPTDWALGAGVHGVTFVAHIGKGKYLEGLLSYYPGAARLDFTPGQGEHPFGSLQEAAGHAIDLPEAFRCLSCHTTGSRIDRGSEEIVIGELGVRCEACHGPGRLHLETVQRQEWELARRLIENPGRSSARRQLDACGSCHREPPVDAARVSWNDPANARFQPIGLSQSSCFRKSGGKLMCTSCHDPHANARRGEPQFYAGICGRCHSAVGHKTAAARGGDCVSCHMPKVEAMRHMEFSNHWIGVYADSNRLVPVRQP